MRPLAAIAAALAVAGAAAGCGGTAKGDGAARVAWVTTPVVYKPADLPRDRVVLAKVRNTSKADVHLVASKLVVRDAQGRVLKSAARYIGGYGHGLYGAFQKPDPLPPQELTRLGYEVTLKPGATAPLSVAWRLPAGAKEPATVDYGGGTLRLPAATAAGD